MNNLPADVSDAIKVLSQYSGARLLFTFEIPLQTPALEPTPIETDHPGPRASLKTMMWALNKLKAAAGQPNRESVRRYLYYRGWIGPSDPPEDWKLEYVPTNKKTLAQIAEDIVRWEVERHAPVLKEEVI